MPRYMIERNFAETLEFTKEEAERVRLINEDEGIHVPRD